MELAPGRMVLGFRLERHLGDGGMCAVWAATDPAGQRIVALKTLLPEAQTNPEIVARFRREAELLARVDSAHVPRFFAFHDDPSGRILVEEFIAGEVLAEVLERRRLSVEEAIDLGMELARALVELHRAGVVHRDLKPGNVILRPLSGGGHRAVLIDLGVSRLNVGNASESTTALTEITRIERAVGTIPYMAPEQFLGALEVAEPVDLYALGAILFRAVAGDHVFGELQGLDVVRAKLLRPAPPLETHRTDRAARGLERVVAHALRRSPQDRYRSAAELLADLLLVSEGALLQPEPPTAPSLLRLLRPTARELSSLATTLGPAAPAERSRRPVALALLAGLVVGALMQRQLVAPAAQASAPVCTSPPPPAAAAPQPPSEPELCIPSVAARAAPTVLARRRVSRGPTPQVVDPEVPRDPILRP